MPAVTRVGDADVAHCSGMTRAEGSPNVTVNGRPVSRAGDNNTSHLRPPNVPPCPSHAAPIATGSRTVTVNGRGIGRVGDVLSGCTSVAEGSPDVTAGDAGGGAAEASLTAPGSSYGSVPGFLVLWQGDFGTLPAAWFAAGADTTLRTVRIDAPLLGGALQIDIGSGRNDLLADIRGAVTLTITTDHGSVTVSGIGGPDTSEPYAWVPANSAELQALFNGISRRRRVAATFTFTRSSG